MSLYLIHVEDDRDGKTHVRHVLRTSVPTVLEPQPGLRGRVARAWPDSPEGHGRVRDRLHGAVARRRHCFFCKGRSAQI